jgi:hypothetical protein
VYTSLGGIDETGRRLMRVDTDGDSVAQEFIVPAYSWSVLPPTGLLWVCLAVGLLFLTREGIYKFCTDLVIFDREREDHLYVGVWGLRVRCEADRCRT